MSEKLDGVRAYWDGMNLKTRNGHPIQAPEWFVQPLPDFKLDGELWLGRQKFAETVSIVRDSEPSKDWRKIRYYIFEVPNQSGDLFQRLDVLKSYLKQNPVTHLKLIEQKPVYSHHQVKKVLQAMIRIGGEGLVIRDPKQPFLSGRQQVIQKVKHKQDAECTVVGYTDGKGKYKGQVGALKCQLLPAQIKRLFKDLDYRNPQVIKIGSGLSDLNREHPPAKGAKVTFQYMGITKNGLPRFPVFLRERSD